MRCNRKGSPLCGALAVLAALSVAAPMTTPVTAQAQDFTFRRVKPPSGDTPRITVQIDPEEQARRLAPVAPRPVVPAPGQPGLPADVATAQFGWFWTRVPAAREAMLFNPLPGAAASD